MGMYYNYFYSITEKTIVLLMKCFYILIRLGLHIDASVIKQLLLLPVILYPEGFL